MKILENKKVVLLEGTRNVPEENQNKLTLFAAEIAKQYPDMIFRSGNASGSDELFAKGIESVDQLEWNKCYLFLILVRNIYIKIQEFYLYQI